MGERAVVSGDKWMAFEEGWLVWRRVVKVGERVVGAPLGTGESGRRSDWEWRRVVGVGGEWLDESGGRVVGVGEEWLRAGGRG